MLTLLTAAAEPLYREYFGSQISLGNVFTIRGLHTKSFLRGSVLGITLTGIFVAYQIAFYMVAYEFGAWSPADVPYDDLLNTRFPWLFVLFSGFFPAVSEEFLFRMFAIPFFKKLVRVTWLALVLAGFIWGFGHAGYPQQPFWIRGVEVGIAGVILGLVMLRWGILPTLVWHYSTDAMYAALLLLRSQSLYFRLSGFASAGIVVLPVAFALFEYVRRGGFDPEGGLTNKEGLARAAAGCCSGRSAPCDDHFLRASDIPGAHGRHLRAVASSSPGVHPGRATSAAPRATGWLKAKFGLPQRASLTALG